MPTPVNSNSEDDDDLAWVDETQANSDFKSEQDFDDWYDSDQSQSDDWGNSTNKDLDNPSQDDWGSSSQDDWDSYETSWDFKRNPLV